MAVVSARLARLGNGRFGVAGAGRTGSWTEREYLVELRRANVGSSLGRRGGGSEPACQSASVDLRCSKRESFVEMGRLLIGAGTHGLVRKASIR